ncbi:AmmeMemoRadiSam system protein B [Candidatus Woesearchaeota archaeon]|nr:AmmeMemoRadiSam system protein B [Candidatus Woesearchaeota archaeon]
MVRKPIVAGQFYPSGKDSLLESIQQSFVHSFGPGLPGKRTDNVIKGVVVPHAGYVFSGACAAWAYKSLAEARRAETYIVLGVNHSGPQTCSSDEDWETPLGIVKCDTELVKEMEKDGLVVDNKAHCTEHSIEVQLPFLQYIDEESRIVAVMIADSEYAKWASMIRKSAENLGRKVVVVCSSDFTHYGSGYGYVPFERDVKNNMKKLDMGAIKYVLEMDAEGFMEYVQKTGATICGKNSVAVMINIMQGAKAKLLKYYTSGDITGYDNAVGYASISFE